MAYQTIFTMITIVCCSLYVSTIEGTGSPYFGNQTDWNRALNVCQERKERLPNVIISGVGLELEGRINWSLGECFWIGATYHRITDDTSGRFPSLCCGVVRKVANNPVFDCVNCDTLLNYVCDPNPKLYAFRKIVKDSNINTTTTTTSTTSMLILLPLPPRSGHNAVSGNSGTYLPWKNASKACHDKGLLLPSETNSDFLGRIGADYWWIDSVRVLNLSPNTAKNDDIPLCFCNKGIENLKCPANVTTYCFPFGESLNEKINATTSTNTHFQLFIPTTMIYTGNATLVGSLTGTAIAVFVTSIIVTIVIIIRIRRKRRANDSIDSEAHMNTRSSKNVQANTVLEDDLQMDSTNKELSQIHDILREPELHTQQQNIKQITSIHKKKDHTTVGDKELPLYSMVQKGHRKKDNVEAIKECNDSHKEYDKIDFEERSVSESYVHVYDKAKIHRLGSDGEHDENVYNKADFNSKAFDTNGSNVYDKGNFSQIQGSDYDIAYEMKGYVEQTYDHI